MNNENNYYFLSPQEITLQAPQELTIQSNYVAPRDTGQVTDLRETISDILQEYGQMVIVQRMNMKIHCMFCWENKMGEPDPKCPYCLGRGYLSIFERHLSRKTSALNEHRLQLLSESPQGDEAIDELSWYFNWDVNIQIEDTIYEVTWRDAQQTDINSLLFSYRVNYSYSFRGEGGRIEYWRASVKSRPVDEVIKGRNLKAVANIALHFPEDGIIRYVVAAQ